MLQRILFAMFMTFSQCTSNAAIPASLSLHLLTETLPLKLTKIRLSDFYPSNHSAAPSAAVKVVRLLWVVDSYKEGNKAYDFYQSAGAVNHALKRLAAENVLNTLQVDLEVAYVSVEDRSCSVAGNLNVVSRVYNEMDYKFDAIIGTQCAEGALAVSAFAESLRKPHILWVAMHPEISNKQRYPYVTKNGVANDLVAKCAMEMFRQLGNWTRVAYLYDRDDYICKSLVWPTWQNLMKAGTENFTIAYSAGLSGIDSTDEQIQSTVLEAARAARIFYVCSAATQDYFIAAKGNRYNNFLLRLMSQAYVLGMYTGEYQWIAQRPMLMNNLWPPYAPIKLNASDVANEHYSLQPAINSLKLPVSENQLYESFRSFLEFDPAFGSLTDDFAFDQQVLGAAFQPPWNVNRTEFNRLVQSGVITNHSTILASYLADGVYLYGLGLRMALKRKLDYGNSAVMHKVFLNITFQGESGAFAINSDGKRYVDLALHTSVRDFFQRHPFKRFEIRGIMRCASLPLAERAAGSEGKLDLRSPLEWYGAIGNRAPSDTPVCGWKNEHCQLLSTTGIVLVACAGACTVFLCMSVIYFLIRRKQRFAALLNTDWNLRQSDLSWPKTANGFSRRTMQSNASSLSVKTDNDDNSDSELKHSQSTLTSATNNGTLSVFYGKKNSALYKHNLKVFVKPIQLTNAVNSESSNVLNVKSPQQLAINVRNLSLDCLRELRGMKDADHDNINRFIGVIVNPTPITTTADPRKKSSGETTPSMLAVTGFCPKGTLAQALYGNVEAEEGDFAAAVPTLDHMFKVSYANDVTNGLNYLHNVSSLKWHGRLSSSAIALDARWTAKLTDFGFWSFGGNCSMNSWIRKTDDEKLFWVAPEVLREPEIFVKTEQGMGKSAVNGGDYDVKFRQAADIYSLGIVFGEILHQIPPYQYVLSETVTISKILQMITSRLAAHLPSDNNEGRALWLFRPYNDSAFREAQEEKQTESSSENTKVAQSITQLMKDCWQESPHERPTVRQVLRRLTKISGKSGHNVMDSIIKKLETYSSNLENIVQARTHELLDEKQRADTLLSRMLPESVAEQLKSGKPVVPEHFQDSTIFFSDIVSFTTISGAATPMQVVQLLNDLYTFMDSTLDRFAPYVYKVETIGDAYMIVSGIPLRTHLHARILASVALAFLANIEEAVHVPKLDNPDASVPTHVRLRVGLNSGPCVAGVVGLQMPRYCLFGDTVNVASRMESNGEAMRIHISHSTRKALEPWPEFTVEDRGVLHIKGKGEMHTYWITNGPQKLDFKNG